MTKAFLIIELRWKITLVKQRGLCELSEMAESFSIVYVTVFRLFIYLMYENTGAVDDWIAKKLSEYKFIETKDITPKREKVSSKWRLFSKMNFTTYHSSCYWIETRTSKNSDELRASEKAYVVVTYSV